MDIKTSIGDFTYGEFISRCDDRSFPEGLQVLHLDFKKCTSLTVLPEGLQVLEYLDLFRCTSLTALPSGLQVGSWLDLQGCDSLESLPDGLHVGSWLNLRYCTSLKSLPEGLRVDEGLSVDSCLIKRHPFKDLPKILHLPFDEDLKQIITDRLRNGY
jgi:hypothetical protein